MPNWRMVGRKYKKENMRIRITFAKTGALRYIGHLDLHKLWERSSRRANLPLMYSQGFHPQPKIQLAAALPLGYSSICELVDLWIDEEVDLTELPFRLSKAVPSGLSILSAERVDDKNPPLQTQIVSAKFKIALDNKIEKQALMEKIISCLECSTIQRERRGKNYDLRPLIESIKLSETDPNEGLIIFLQLAAREGATGRPEEVLDVLNIPFEETKIERCQFIFKE